MKKKILQKAAEMIEAPAEELVFMDGRVWHPDRPEQYVTFADVAMRYKTRNGFLPIVVSGMRPNAAPPSWAAVFAEVAVDLETGAVKVEKIAMGLDIGRVVNPAEAEAQAHGGIATGIGYALTEEVVVKEGRYINPNFMDYLLPSAAETNNVTVFFADSYDDYGPYGAKSIGELATNPVASAIANAVSRALKTRIRKLPIKPEDVWRAVGRNPATG
jgi:CO/xanthine dehydrogenase Mo-binding subunit